MRFDKEEMEINHNQPRNILVGIRFDVESKELLGWAIVKVAELHDHVVAVHVCRNSGTTFYLCNTHGKGCLLYH